MIASIRCFVLSLAVALPALTYAHPSVEEITTTWTGLERAGDTPGTHMFTLVLNSAETTAAAGPRTTDHSVSHGSGQRLTGTWTTRALGRDRQGRQPPAVVQTAEADYFPDVGILRVTRRPERGGAGFICLLVFDANATRLAGVYTGAMRDITPLYASRGTTLKPELASLAGLPADPRTIESNRDRSANVSAAAFAQALADAYAAGDYSRAMSMVNERRQTVASSTGANTNQPLPSAPNPTRDFPGEIAALSREIQDAARAKDTQRINQLQEKLRELRSDMSAQRRPQASPVATLTTRCPDHIVAWTAQLEAFGGALEHFEGNIPASNLFRPRLFSPHFGKSFAALSVAERAAIGRDLQRNCLQNGSRFGAGSLISALIGAFQNTPGFDTTEAGLGGLAVELIADWTLRSVQELNSEADAIRVTDFETKSTQLISVLWPRERDDTRQHLAALKSRNHGRRLLAEVDSLGRAAATGHADALQRLVNLMAYADAANVSPADRALLLEKQAATLTSSSTAFLGRARADVLSVPVGLDHLLRGKAWLAANGEVLQTLRGRPEADAFYRDFVAGRAASYATEQARLAREVVALDSMDAARSFGLSFAIYLDTEASPVWKELDAQRQARISAFEQRDALALAEGGPFGADYPGARYLNALWRNDQKRIEEMDRQWREPYLAQLNMLEQIDYTPDLLAKFTGGTRSADQVRRLRRALLEEASLTNGLLVAFAYGYEEAYPKCMEPDAKEIRILVRHESMMRNLLGWEIGRYPAGTSVITHRVNQRHLPAIEDLAIADPNDRIVTEALLGRPGSPVSQLRIGMGLSRAMREHPCDSELIRRLEAGMLARWESFSTRKHTIKRRILGDAR